jgi:hypothetical protein
VRGDNTTFLIKENKMKKTLVLALAALVCFGLVLSCGGEDEPKPDKPKEFTVTFDRNADGVTGAAANPAPVKVKSGQSLGSQFPTTMVTTDSHTFNGWFTQKSGGAAFTKDTKVTSNITVYGRWTSKSSDDPTKWKVTFEYDGGVSNPVGPAFVEVLKSPVQSVGAAAWPKDPAKASSYTTHYTFDKWYEMSGQTMTNTVYTATTDITKDVTVKAKYTETPVGGGGDDDPPTPDVGPLQFGDGVGEIPVTGDGATTAYISNGAGYSVEKGNYGTYASFGPVDLGDGNRLTNFEKITFDYEAISGDIGYKALYLLVSDDPFPGANDVNTGRDAFRVSGFGYSTNDPGTATATCVLGEFVDEQGTKTYVANNARVPIKSKVYVSVYIQSETAKFSVSNVKFHGAPAYTAVTDIVTAPLKSLFNTQCDLTVAQPLPAWATNWEIVWALGEAGTTGTTAITAGKFTPPAAGWMTVKATITGGKTATTPYEKVIQIGITNAAAAQDVPITGTISGCTGTVDSDGLGFQITSGVNYEHSAAVFTLNLGSNTLGDVSRVTFNYVPVSGDTNYKPIHFVAGASPGTSLGLVQSGDVPSGGVSLAISPTVPDEFDLATVTVGFQVRAGSTANFKITNIKYVMAVVPGNKIIQ